MLPELANRIEQRDDPARGRTALEKGLKFTPAFASHSQWIGWPIKFSWREGIRARIDVVASGRQGA
jgi:hypothetical protein